MARKRGEAFEGKGYGTQRFHLQRKAKERIERSLKEGYYCEAIAITESLIADRLESRVSHLKGKNVGFEVLGNLIKEARNLETDQTMKDMIEEVNLWRVERNTALHELVKVEKDVPAVNWDERMEAMGRSATKGYDIFLRLFHQVADLNPEKHPTRAFPRPVGQ